MKYLLYYLLIINIISFIIYGIDKKLARLNKRRISERFLYFLGVIGGGIGCFIGMYIFRHKTKKVRFYLWNIFVIILWIYLIYNFYF